MMSIRWILATLSFSLLSNPFLAAQSQQVIIKPAPLRSGDAVMFVAPSGALKNTLGLIEQEQHWKSLGFRVNMPQHPDRRLSYLAGSDDERANELNQAFRDPTVKAIFPVRGGFGLTRILDRLDYEALGKNPKIITGFSDVTALHLAIARKVGMVTFHTPIPMRQTVQIEEPEYTLRSFQKTVLWEQLRKPSTSTNIFPGYRLEMPDKQPAVETLTKGKATGRLMGGNLTMICSTLGTPYALQPEGKILFLEDVHEAPYRIDRNLSQLRLAGILDKVNGIILGSFTSDDPKEAEDMDRVLRSYFTGFRVPVVWRFPVGHGPYNATIPLNVQAELDAEARTLQILESPLKNETCR
jgi:muramoyltetrapeptide carboxypeptidase